MNRAQAAPRSAAPAPAQDERTRPLPPSSPSSSSSSSSPTAPQTSSTLLSTNRNTVVSPTTSGTSSGNLSHVPYALNNLTDLGDAVNSSSSSSSSSSSQAGQFYVREVINGTGTGTGIGTFFGLNRSVSPVPASTAAGGGGGSTENFTRQKAEFYQSYNPQIGVHTAAVLGGILGWLIIYLLYKTKVKKWVLYLVRKDYNRREKQQQRKEKNNLKKKKKKLHQLEGGFVEVPVNDPGSEDPAVLSPNPSAATKNSAATANNIPESEGVHHHHHPYPQLQAGPGDSKLCPQERLEAGTFPPDMCGGPAVPPPPPPMPSIVVESCSSLPNSKPALNAQGHEALPVHATAADSSSHMGKDGSGSERKKKYRRKKDRGGQGRGQCPEVTVLDVDDPDTTTLLLPPCSQADSAQATARWVQTMPLLMQSHLDVTGLLLKVRSPAVMVGSKKQQSCPLISAALQYAALPLLGGLPPHLGYNNSMPHLPDTSSLKNSADLLFHDDGDEDVDRRNQNATLLQPLPYSSAPCSRPQSSQSHIGGGVSLSHPHPLPPLTPTPAPAPALLLPARTPPPALPTPAPPTPAPALPAPPAAPPAPSPLPPVAAVPPPPVPAWTPPIPSRCPPPRLTISIPDPAGCGPATACNSVLNSTLAVPGWLTSPSPSSVPASPFPFLPPSSPVPLPVTPTVTIQNCTPRGAGARKGGGGVGGEGDSEDSASSSSSLDPLLLPPVSQNDCPPDRPSPSPFPSHHHHHHNLPPRSPSPSPARPPPSPLPPPLSALSSPPPLPPPSPLSPPLSALSSPPPLQPSSPHPLPSPLARAPPPPLSPLPLPPPSPAPSALARTASSPRASWTVFDDDDRPGGGGSGGGGDGGGGGGGGAGGACSRQNSLRFTFPATGPAPGCENGEQGNPTGSRDVVVTLETKL